MTHLENAINQLKQDRKIFHSEDDLKLALALTIKKLYPELEIRLERPVEIQMVDRNPKEPSHTKRAPIDIVVIDQEGKSTPIELKYKTKLTEVELDHEIFKLTNHSAPDVGRYSFRKDIFRVEKYLESQSSCATGYVLILTNENNYFEDISNKNTIDSFYSFHHGATLSQIDEGWNYNKIDQSKYHLDEKDNKWKSQQKSESLHWTCKGDLFFKLDLSREYKIAWEDYSDFEGARFKYCLIKIESTIHD